MKRKLENSELSSPKRKAAPNAVGASVPEQNPEVGSRTLPVAVWFHRAAWSIYSYCIVFENL